MGTTDLVVKTRHDMTTGKKNRLTDLIQILPESVAEREGRDDTGTCIMYIINIYIYIIYTYSYYITYLF